MLFDTMLDGIVTNNMLSQTDGARNMFEKATGKDVPDKVSN